jgi:glycosyltransferase involved in cell wall biosynthesis
LSPEKDPLTFVRAILELGAREDVVGLLGGDGSLRANIGRVAGRDSLLRMLGWVDDPATLFSAADVFVSTSRWEGLPLAVLEAAASGLPLVLTDVPGNRDVVDRGVPAILVPAGDPAAVASAIAALDEERRMRMGARAAEIVDHEFRPANLAEDVLAVYWEISPSRRSIRSSGMVP